MSYKLGDLMENVDVLPEEDNDREANHRIKGEVKRPDKEVDLKRFAKVPFERKKVQLDPTSDLVEIQAASSYADVLEICAGQAKDGDEKYLIWCGDTQQMWFAPNKACLDANFIWRDDLEIISFSESEEAEVDRFVSNRIKLANPGIKTRKKCYILDNPAGEMYEVYYDPTYPSMQYGKATPNGMFIHCYDNRFHRDMAIMKLDKLYEENSVKTAQKLLKRQLGDDEAIIVSDGAYLHNCITSSFYYIDNKKIRHTSIATEASEVDQSVLTSEINGAYEALMACYVAGKKNIRYYYDNTSILNVFKNRKTEYIEEIKEYKSLVEKMYNEGFAIEFIELHPKTGDDRDTTNVALMFFHNYCDKACREISDIYKKDYVKIAQSDNKRGKDYGRLKQEFRPKGRPGQSNGNNRPGGGYNNNNSRNGNNRYGKRF